MSRYVIGIDAGASKTRALALARDGVVVGEGEAAGANLLVSEEAPAQIQLAIERARGSIRDPDAVALCAAGVEDEATRHRATAMLRKITGTRHVVVAADAVAALYAASPDGVGVVLLSGTGSIAYGRDAQGREARSGGWGYLFGDEGSAAWLGLAALRAAARAADGRGPRTRLLARLVEELRVSDLREALPQAYGAPHPSPTVIAAARVLARAADEDEDDEARRIIAEAADELATAAAVVAARLGIDEVFLGGGAFATFPALEHATRARLTAILPRARIETLHERPVRGAARLAALVAWGEPV